MIESVDVKIKNTQLDHLKEIIKGEYNVENTDDLYLDVINMRPLSDSQSNTEVDIIQCQDKYKDKYRDIKLNKLDKFPLNEFNKAYLFNYVYPYEETRFGK